MQRYVCVQSVKSSSPVSLYYEHNQEWGCGTDLNQLLLLFCKCFKTFTFQVILTLANKIE